jgi:nucleoside-diphosphate-sugar epimerase
VLLLTGATGLVGGELLRRYPAGRVLAVARDPAAVGAGITALRGDVAEPGLGLGADDLALVRRTVTDVVHCAADTRFGLPLEQARRTNVTGTRHVVEIARDCPRLRRLAHVSTLFIVGRSTGTFAELPLRHENGFLNTYQRSKYEAEDVVLEAAAAGLPAAIIRLSSIVGDSRTGHVRQFNYVHRLLRLLPRNVLPVVPGDPAAPVDLIPTDWTGAALRQLLERPVEPGRISHVCAGERSPAVRELIDLIVDSFARHPRAAEWSPVRVPELVPLAEYETYVAEARRGGDRLLDELLRALGLFLPHLGLRQAFVPDAGLTPPPAARDYFGKVVRHCIDTGWGRR